MIDNYFSPDTCALVTTYCPEPFSDKKLHMTKTICEKLKQAGFFVCLSSHSVLSEEFQELVDFFIYDKDNTFKIGKYPEHVINHGVGEFKLIHDAIGSLKRFNFKYLYKFAYDVNPQLNFIDILNKCKAMDKKLISANWNDVYPKNSIGALAFFSEIDFL